MRQNIIFYAVSFALLAFVLVSFSHAYDELISSTKLMQRRNAVYECFQSLSIEINNAAISNSDLSKAKASMHLERLFSTDSATAMGKLTLLKSLVTDSTKIAIVDQLEAQMKAEFSWLLYSNVPDSIIHHKARRHLASFSRMDSLITEGSKRTTFLIAYENNRLAQIIHAMIFWMIAFALLSTALLVYTSLSLIQKTKTSGAEKLLKKTASLVSDYQYAIDESSIVAITDNKGLINYVNDNFCRISKYTREELAGHDHRIINSGYHSTEFIRGLWDTISQGKIWKGELRNRAKDGSFYWVATTIVPFLNNEGKPYQYIAISADITERKKIETLIIRNQELDFQRDEKDKSAAQQMIISKTDELLVANKELLFQRDEKGKRAVELTETLERVSFLDSIAYIIQDPVISFDNNLIITRWNAAAEKLFEWKPENAIGKTTSEILRPSFPNDGREQIMQSILTEGFWHGELIYHTERGNPVDVLVTLSRLKDLSGSSIGSVILVRDITARKKAEDALSKLNKELERRVLERTAVVAKTLKEKNVILESIADAFFAVDQDWIVTYWNRIAETALRVPKQEILGKNLWEIFKDSLDSESYKKYHEALRTNETIHFEDNYPTLNKWYEISAYPSETGLSVYFKDVTERKKIQEEIKTLNENLEERVIARTTQLEVANKELESFSYSVSHDLRAPLRAVNGFARMLKEDYGDTLPPDALRLIGKIGTNAVKMSQLIDDLLSFSRLGRKALQKRKISMNEMVKETCAEVQDTDVLRNIEYRIENLPPILADNILLKQVWVNLLSNALKYSRLKEKTIIEIGSTEDHDTITYHVKDNGAGFSMDYVDKLFGVFQRLHTEEEFEGTGVGLAIVKRIIGKHGGNVWAEGKVNEGAAFYFSLPKS